MSEDNNDNDNIIKTSRGKVSQEEFKLPKLVVAPQSRGRMFNNRKEGSKAPTLLPSINDDTSQERNFRQTAGVSNITRISNDITVDNPDDSPHQHLTTQDKLNLLMHPQQPISQSQTSSNFNLTNINTNTNNDQQQLSDDLDFEQKILQNKEIIKMHRKIMNQPIGGGVERRKNIDGGGGLVERGIENRTKLSGKHQQQQQTIYERKMRQYHLSLENKYLQRKKQSLGIIPQKQQKPFQKVKSKKTIPSMQQAPPMIKEIKSNFGYGKFKNSAITKSQARQGLHGLGSGKRGGEMGLVRSERGERREQNLAIRQGNKVGQQAPTSTQAKKTPRTSALFDNIQSFLQNPTAADKHEKFYKDLFSKLKTKSLTQLQQQLKQINQKLGPSSTQNFDTKQTLPKQQPNSPIPTMQQTARDWKRIDITSKTSLKCKQSDFEKQLQYISYLQERNSASLKKFVEQEKLMLEIKFNKKFNKNNGQVKEKVVGAGQYVEEGL